MKLQSQKLIEHLASQYVLGQLAPLTKRCFERYAHERSDIRAAISAWEERVHALARSVPAQAPRADLLQRIETQLFGVQSVAAQFNDVATKAETSRQRWWQQFASRVANAALPAKLVAAGALGVLLGAFLMNAIVLRPKTDDVAALQRDALPASYVGLLLDSKDVATLLASSLRHGKTLTIKMLKPLPNDASVRYRLWAMPNEGAPFSLGLVPISGLATIALPDTSEKLLSKVQRLVVFAEPANSASVAPSGAPTGTPVLSGNCVKLW